MPLINFTGLASGIDAEALIKATSDVTKQVRVKPIERQVTQLEDTNEALNQMKGILSSLQTITRGYSTVDGGPVRKRASSSDETIMSATASGSAANGSNEITITNVAKAGSWSSYQNNGVKHTATSSPINPNINDGLPDGDRTIVCTVGDQTAFNIVVTSTTTLSDFVSQFNAQTTLAVASLTNVGTSADPDYRVVINARETGTVKGGVSIAVPTAVSDPTGLPADQRWNSNGGSPAENAQFTITGITGTISRTSNTVSDVLPGVTFNIKTEGGPITIGVSDDISSTASKVREFITKYNELVAFIQENDQIIREQNGSQITNTFQPLSLTRVDDNVTTAIRSAMGESAYYNTGSSVTAQNAIRIFADLGITTDSGPYNADTKTGGGTLKFDEAVFTSAMEDEPESVNQIFMNFGDIVGRVNRPDNVTPGVIQQFVRANGLIETTVNNNKETIDSLNERITQIEAQILQQETLMRQRFSRLESTIGRLQNQQGALNSALAGLPRN